MVLRTADHAHPRHVDVLGIVLAGGEGARLSTGPVKPLRMVGGMTLLERAVGVLRDVSDEVVVVAPVERELPTYGGRRVNDPPDMPGPLAGMVAGFGAARFVRAVVLGVDFPLMVPATLEALLAGLDAGVAVVPAPRGIPQPLAAAYRPEAAERLSVDLHAGERAPVPAVRALGATLLDDAAIAAMPGGAESFFNLNTPEDLAHAERVLAERAEHDA